MESLRKFWDDIKLKLSSTRREVLGERHPDTLNSLHNLASLYLSSSRSDLARELMRPALPFVEGLPPEHEVRLALEELAQDLDLG